jgi:hypothetical protein
VSATTIILKVTAATAAAVVGALFFFLIIGVFELFAAVAALITFWALSLIIFRRSPSEEGHK